MLNCHFECDKMARGILFKDVVKFPGQSSSLELCCQAHPTFAIQENWKESCWRRFLAGIFFWHQ